MALVLVFSDAPALRDITVTAALLPSPWSAQLLSEARVHATSYEYHRVQVNSNVSLVGQPVEVLIGDVASTAEWVGSEWTTGDGDGLTYHRVARTGPVDLSGRVGLQRVQVRVIDNPETVVVRAGALVVEP